MDVDVVALGRLVFRDGGADDDFVNEICRDEYVVSVCV